MTWIEVLNTKRRKRIGYDTEHGNFSEVLLTIQIKLFLVFGACFGLLTFSRRHLFSEGPKTKDETREGNAVMSRLIWMLICTFLWPIMIITGIHTAWILHKRKSQASVEVHDL